MICPFCKASFVEKEPVVACLQCSTIHHPDCWIENRNQCTVFRCDGFHLSTRLKFSQLRHQSRSIAFSIFAILLITANYVFHFFIPDLRPVLATIALPDLTVVFGIELSFIVSSLLLLIFSHRNLVYSPRQDPALFFAGMVFSTNVIFVVSLLYYGLTSGWNKLATVIYF
jgi:hypothetical protein